MADFYWIGSGGNTNSAANWSLTSGGAGGAGVPTSADNVFFDANSGDATVNATLQLLTFDSTAYTGTLTGTFTTINVFGSCYLSSTTAFSNLTLTIRGITSSSVDFHYPFGYAFNFTGVTVVVGVLASTTINFNNDLIIDGSILTLTASTLITGNPQILLYTATLNYAAQIVNSTVKMKFLGNVIANNVDIVGRTRLAHDIEIDCGSNTLTLAGGNFPCSFGGTLKYISGNINWNGFGLGIAGTTTTIDFTPTIPYLANSDTSSTLTLLSDLTISGDYNILNGINLVNNSGSAKTLSVGGNWNSTTNQLAASGSDPINITMIGTGYITGYILGNFTIAGDYDLRDIYTATNTVFTYSSGTLTYASATLLLRSCTLDLNYPGLVWQSINYPVATVLTLLSDIYTVDFFVTSTQNLSGTSNGFTIYIINFYLNATIAFNPPFTFRFYGSYNTISQSSFTSSQYLHVNVTFIIDGDIEFLTEIATCSKWVLNSGKLINARFRLDPQSSAHFDLKGAYVEYLTTNRMANNVPFSLFSNLKVGKIIEDPVQNQLTQRTFTCNGNNNTLEIGDFNNDWLIPVFNSTTLKIGNSFRSNNLLTFNSCTLIGAKNIKVKNINITQNTTLLTDGIPDGINVDNPLLISSTTTTRANISIIGKPTEIAHNIQLSNINIVSGTHNLLEGTQQYAGLGLTRSDWNLGGNSGNIFHETNLPKGLIGNNPNSV